MRTATGAIVLSSFMLAGCAGAAFPPVPTRAKAAMETYAARVHAIVSSWETAGGSRTHRPPDLQGGDTAQAPVSAAWWGFDQADGTRSLQAAFDSGARTILVPYMGSPWIVSRTLDIRSGSEILLEPGVVLLAAAGAFRETGESLLRSADTRDFSLLGYGAAIRMRKRDYQAAPYEPGQWRHGITLRGVSHALIAGVSIESSGGDGVYIGTSSHQASEDLVLRDLDIVDNHRQGISVISARGLLIENCLIAGTSGTRPMAGIDFEPNANDPGFQDCVVSNCRIEHNAGYGILLVLKNLDADSAPVSIQLRGCSIDNLPVAAWLHGLENHVRGTLTVSACSFTGIAWLKGSSDFSVSFPVPKP
jgi:hypothetical protein